MVADDSGLEVDALGGAPGVRSARYAVLRNGGAADRLGIDGANNRRLLEEMRGIPEGQRTARFVCALAMARDGEIKATVRGEARGRILEEPRGSGGFGYDPLLYVVEVGKTFAEFSAEEKARASHRGRAFEQLARWMKTQTLR